MGAANAYPAPGPRRLDTRRPLRRRDGRCTWACERWGGACAAYTLGPSTESRARRRRERGACPTARPPRAELGRSGGLSGRQLRHGRRRPAARGLAAPGEQGPGYRAHHAAGRRRLEPRPHDDPRWGSRAEIASRQAPCAAVADATALIVALTIDPGPRRRPAARRALLLLPLPAASAPAAEPIGLRSRLPRPRVSPRPSRPLPRRAPQLLSLVRLPAPRAPHRQPGQRGTRPRSRFTSRSRRRSPATWALSPRQPMASRARSR